jgi:hypothetical protein
LKVAVMSGISGINSAMQGIYRGMEGVRKNAAEIASPEQFTTDSPISMTKSMVELRENATLVKASVSAVKIIEETIGSILDIRA